MPFLTNLVLFPPNGSFNLKIELFPFLDECQVHYYLRYAIMGTDISVMFLRWLNLHCKKRQKNFDWLLQLIAVKCTGGQIPDVSHRPPMLSSCLQFMSQSTFLHPFITHKIFVIAVTVITKSQRRKTENAWVFVNSSTMAQFANRGLWKLKDIMQTVQPKNFCWKLMFLKCF